MMMTVNIPPEAVMVLIMIGAFLGYLTARWLLRDKTNSNPPKDQESYYEWVMKRREEARREHDERRRR